MAISLGWNLHQERQEVQDVALMTARTNFEKDIRYRRWAAMHGGVYVPATFETPPNPFLAHVPERDLTTPSGRQLTLMNPAYMTRQVYAFSRKVGHHGHIAVKALRPENPERRTGLKSWAVPPGPPPSALEGQHLRLMPVQDKGKA
jgi:hypothetical protein